MTRNRSREKELSIMKKGGFYPANIELAGLETSLVNVMSREMVLRQYICGIKNSMIIS